MWCDNELTFIKQLAFFTYSGPFLLKLKGLGTWCRPHVIGHCRNVRGLGKRWLFSVCLKN